MSAVSRSNGIHVDESRGSQTAPAASRVARTLSDNQLHEQMEQRITALQMTKRKELSPKDPQGASQVTGLAVRTLSAQQLGKHN